MVAKGKRTFWISSAHSTVHHDRCELLAKNGFDVVRMSTLHDVTVASKDSRPACVIIDTPAPGNHAGLQLLQTLATLPEIDGARFILSVTHASPESMRVAVSENFRDVIPLNISNANWIQRVQFASAARPVEFPAPLCEISMNQLAVALAPGRVIWINESHIKIECKGNQRIGSSLQISGAIAKAMGVPHLSLTVESIQKDQLMFRFSQALVCRWRVAGAQSDKAASMIRNMQTDGGISRLRAFIAITRPEVRNSLASKLNAEHYNVKVGLQKNNLAQEFSYFSPDVVFMDDILLKALREQDTKTMFSKLPGDIPLVIFGESIEKATLTSLFETRPTFVERLNALPQIQNTAHRYRVVTHVASTEGNERVAQIPSEHPWSKIEVHVPARLTSLNPSVGAISLPFSMGAFTIARLEAPILRKALGRDPYIKITDMVERTSGVQPSQFTHHGHFYLADVDLLEQLKLSEALLGMVNQYYQKQFNSSAASSSSAGNTIPMNATIAHASSAPMVSGSLAFKAPPPTPPTPPSEIPQTAPQAAPQNIQQSIQQPVTPPSNEVKAEEISIAPETINTKLRREIFKPEIELDLSLNLKKYFDPTVIKAVAVFAIAIGFTAFLLYLAGNTDESSYKDHGRQYSDFFLRMSDPEFRKKNPAPGLPALDDRDKNDKSDK